MNISLNLVGVNNQTDIATAVSADHELDLVNGLRQRDRKAQESFYKSYYGKMMPTAMRYASNREDANEIINNAFLKVINSMDKYTHQNNFGGWVSTIVKRSAIDYCRKFKYNKPTTFELIEVDKSVYNNAIEQFHQQQDQFSTYLFSKNYHIKRLRKKSASAKGHQNGMCPMRGSYWLNLQNLLNSTLCQIRNI